MKKKFLEHAYSAVSRDLNIVYWDVQNHKIKNKKKIQEREKVMKLKEWKWKKIAQ